MMNEMNEKDLQFVVEHYIEGRCDAEKAWKVFKHKSGMMRTRRIRHMLVAASVSFAAILAVAATIVSQVNGTADGGNAPAVVSDTLKNADRADSVRKDSVVVFHFDNTPISRSLEEVSDCYGVKLTASDTTKRVSGEFESHSLEEAVRMLEATLDVVISKE